MFLNVSQWFTENAATIGFVGIGVAVIVAYMVLVNKSRKSYADEMPMSPMSIRNTANDALLRHIISSIGGALVILGVITETVSTELMGGLLLFISIIQSWQGLDKDTFVEKLSGVLRHVITAAGAAGWIVSEEKWHNYAGLVLTIAGVLWSLFAKKSKMDASVSK